jgi:acyl-CoA reductase-like NAD-dependent aldehyde dehydrogenase
MDVILTVTSLSCLSVVKEAAVLSHKVARMSIDWVDRSRALKLHVQNFIGGRKAEGSGVVITKYGPRDGKALLRFAAGNSRDVDLSVRSARAAFEDGRWSRLPVQRRSSILHKFAALLEEQRESLALLECLDVGKPIKSAMEFDVPMAAAVVRYNAEAADKILSSVYGADEYSLSYELRRPVGVVAGIVGWNFPLLLAAGKLAPVLAMGNCMILKPSELTSLSAARLAEIGMEAGLPEGVFNIVNGDGTVGAELAQHRGVDLVTFTGSTQTGKRLLAASGNSNLKRTILECGGKAPSIVFDDSPDLEQVADAIVSRSFWNQGQVCTASSRLLVQRSVKEELVGMVRKKVSELHAGDPLDPTTRYGAVVSEAHRHKILGYIDIAEREGATIAYKSEEAPPCKGGFYVSPVVFDDVLPSHRIAQEEVFGPLLSVLTFRDEEEAVAIANGTLYGLSATVWTKSLGRAHRVSQGVKAGWVVVNATAKPAGGPGVGALSIGGHKESGLGAEGGLRGLEEYTIRTAVQLFV